MAMLNIRSVVRTLTSTSRCSSPPIYAFFSSSVTKASSLSPSSSSATPDVDVVVSGGAADVAGDDLLLDDSPDSTVTAAKATLPSLLQPRVVVYDGVCHLFHKGVKWVIQADKDKKIKFCCLQSQAAEPYMRLCGVDREDVLRCFLFIEGPDVYHQGSTAALRVLSYLPLPFSALSTLRIVPTPLREVVYDYVAKQRYD
ncbi:uncharacterized protein LOC130791496 [Actinidia eriantha]|uniref:uncharacterized protein LOC130791496 n=1 Tax=Actinidia eriantha TaxID=165200 RepID=UPI002591010C|nr:uncharacterized protein LOC130791496 [Actinidia eriantha]